eukprot:4610836-Lingulodinium_polyedra.AAC.1
MFKNQVYGERSLVHLQQTHDVWVAKLLQRRDLMLQYARHLVRNALNMFDGDPIPVFRKSCVNLSKGTLADCCINHVAKGAAE